MPWATKNQERESVTGRTGRAVSVTRGAAVSMTQGRAAPVTRGLAVSEVVWVFPV